MKQKKSKYFRSKNDQDELQSQKFHEHNISSGNEKDLYASDAEKDIQESIGNKDTLVDEKKIENRTLIFAPGENQQPLSIYQDLDSEYLCAPSLFCGLRRLKNNERLVPLHCSDIAKCKLRSYDRRAANSVPSILSSSKKYRYKICRFGFQLRPLPKTMVLDPLESDVDKYKRIYFKLQHKMNKQKNGYEMC